MVSPQLSQILQSFAIGATIVFIALLVMLELTPAFRRRQLLRLLLPCFAALVLVIVSGAMAHKS